ncbi:DUF1642 domain-containing protein [Listeria booriae]|uniref:DUF1642 domain-containing protein n=1 Tax=Listeria booriae TaxID=1552123 RepID=A0A7X0YZY1_9LIST|nr:DUF1642 domain-containing protein [Listeria booriae]MBC2166172.1 DUF1642 domain-containing protein [Listeria booriae]
MTQKFKVGDRVQVIRDSKIEIDTITFKDGTIYQLQDKSWVEDCRLAPAPALVVVPKTIGDFIKARKKHGDNLYKALYKIREYRNGWLFEKEGRYELFARAWLDGYEVEEEPLYYIKLPALGFLVDEPEIDFVVSKEFASKFNKAQIKAVDERYWQFAVPVEEEAE